MCYPFGTSANTELGHMDFSRMFRRAPLLAGALSVPTRTWGRAGAGSRAPFFMPLVGRSVGRPVSDIAVFVPLMLLPPETSETLRDYAGSFSSFENVCYFSKVINQPPRKTI